MKTLNLKVNVSDEEYAIVKAALKTGECEYSILLYGIENTFNHFDNRRDLSKKDGEPLEDDVKIFFKEFDRIKKMLGKKK